MNTPSVGRVLHFRFRGSDPDSQPLAATIAHVNEDGTVNIGYLDTAGVHRNAIHVRLVEEDLERPDSAVVAFCEWPGRTPQRSKKDVEAEREEKRRAEQVERDAETIYNSWADHADFVPWVPGGNSDKQNEARKLAQEPLDEGTALEVEPTEENTRPDSE